MTSDQREYTYLTTRPAVPDLDRAQRRLEAHRRYNASAKGQARNARYESKHPERKVRWEAARNAVRPGGGAARI